MCVGDQRNDTYRSGRRIFHRGKDGTRCQHGYNVLLQPLLAHLVGQLPGSVVCRGAATGRETMNSIENTSFRYMNQGCTGPLPWFSISYYSPERKPTIKLYPQLLQEGTSGTGLAFSYACQNSFFKTHSICETGTIKFNISTQDCHLIT